MNSNTENKNLSSLQNQELAKKKKLYEQINNIKKLKQNQYVGQMRQRRIINKSNLPEFKVNTIEINNQKLNQVSKPKQNYQQQEILNNQKLVVKQIQKNQTLNKQKTVQPEKKQIDIIQERQKQNEIDDKIMAISDKIGSIKRTSQKLVFSQALQNQINKIEKKVKKIKDNVVDNQNQSTCIQISSSQDQNINSQQNKMICHKQIKTQKIKLQQSHLAMKNIVTQQITNQLIKYPQTVQHSIKALFANYKVNYVYINEQILVKYKKQKRRLESQNKQFKSSQSKILLSSSYISVAKTIPIQFIAEKIIKKDFDDQQIKNSQFWIFKGSIKDFQEIIIKTVKQDNACIESKKLVLLKQLYDWYTLAHLLISSTNIVIVIQKTNVSPVIRNYYQPRCCICKSSKLQICLCMRFFKCRQRTCMQQLGSSIQQHQEICKFSSLYRQCNIRSQFTSTSKRGVIGLINYQNSCFMNTAIQCLASCEPLTQYFLEKQYMKNINYGNHLGTFGEISTRYAQLLREMFITSNRQIQLRYFKHSLGRWDNKYIADDQEDCQQFLTQLLDWLKEDLNLNNSKPQYIHQEDTPNLKSQEKADLAWKSYLSRNNSIIEFLMAGMLRSKIQCGQCLYQSDRFQTFLTLPLPLTKSCNSTQHIFEIKVIMIYENFRKKNQSKIITLKSYKYNSLMDQVTKTFNLQENSYLIEFVCVADNIIKIEDSYKNILLQRIKQNSEARLIFVEQTQYEIKDQIIEIYFSFRLKQRNYEIPTHFKRSLIFTKQETPTASNLYKKVLTYFYHFMYKNQNKVSLQNYLEMYLDPNKIPFKIHLNKLNLQIQTDQSISLMNKTEVVITFENYDIYSIKQLFKTILIPKQKYNNGEFISIQQKNQKSKMKIQQCFQQFQRVDVMDGENSWYCPSCKKKRRAFKNMSIYKAPKILILFFKRFQSKHNGYQHTMKKIQTFVQFPHLLDLKEYVTNEQLPYTGQKLQLKYRLFAVANHIDIGLNDVQNGHYIAFVNHLNGWFKINDEKIEPFGQSDICTKNAYILFYSR